MRMLQRGQSQCLCAHKLNTGGQAGVCEYSRGRVCKRACNAKPHSLRPQPSAKPRPNHPQPSPKPLPVPKGARTEEAVNTCQGYLSASLSWLLQLRAVLRCVSLKGHSQAVSMWQ